MLSCTVLVCSEVLKYGRYRGFTSLGIVFQTMDNTHLRKALGMKAHQTGVLINRIQPTTSTAKVRRHLHMPAGPVLVLQAEVSLVY